MKDINQIVIIDDNKIDCFINQKICSLAFEKSSIRTFSSSMRALDYFLENSELQGFLQNNSTDLILLDINMPELNGFEFLKKLAKSNIFNENLIDVYFLSSSNNEKDIYEALSIDFCSGYIMKPLTKDKLIEALACKNKKEYFLINNCSEIKKDVSNDVA
jgi:CheY-like chemotaxis protein